MTATEPLFTIERKQRNVHVIRLTEKRDVLLISDLHWDNPKCDRKLLKSHLDEAVKRNAIILINGDAMCLMQGKFDPRGTKKDVRPEHNKGNYLDLVIEDFADYMTPYAHHIGVIGYGNHECYDDQTEVLTNDGWKLFKELNKTELIATLNRETGLCEWQKPSNYSTSYYDGKMHKIKSRSTDFVITPNHKIIYQRQHKTTYDEIRSNELSYSKGASLTIPVSAKSANVDYNISDDELRILAWVYTDGSICKERIKGNSSYVKIFQSKSVKKITDILDRLGWAYSVNTRTRRIDNICGKELINKTSTHHTISIAKNGKDFILNHISDKKRLSDIIKFQLSDRQFDVFLSSYIDGDGSRHKSALSSMMAYGNRPILEDLQLSCLTHGYKCSMSTYRKTCFRLNITKRDAHTITQLGTHFSEIDYIGNVYCLTVPNGNMFIRRNGISCVSGNTNIIKRLETDPLQRAVDLMNYKAGSNVQTGGYGGWVVFAFKNDEKSNRAASFKIKYFHGSGGGGVVTKGTINHQRLDTMISDADCIWGAHIHDQWTMSIMVEELNNNYSVEQKEVLHVQTPSYKNEYDDGNSGWHIERGAPPKPLGGYWMQLEPKRIVEKLPTGNKDGVKIYARVTKTDY